MNMLPPVTPDTKVLIIGGGPTGLTAALLLARYGLPSVIVERHLGQTGQPKAHAINPRSLEIFRQISLDTAELRRQGMKAEDGEAVRFMVSLAGEELGTLRYERQGEETKAITPEPLFNIPQPLLEDFLMKATTSNEMITFYRGMQWESCSQISKNVLSSTITDRATGGSKIIESKYILDCGGANSRARQRLEIPFSPLPDFIQNKVHHVSVHIKADLTMFKPGTLFWIVSTLVEGTFICYDRSSDWVFVTYLDPKNTPRETFSEEYCRAMIDRAIGENIPYEIRSIVLWDTWPRTAEFFQSRRFPRAFVVGDAAHAFPPTGGLGVNTGIADAQNLAWKINAVEKSWADESIFASYSAERRPVAVANACQSVKNQVRLRSLKAALRDPPDTVNRSDRAKWQTKLDKELQANSEHFDSINLQIGYVYGACEHSDEPCDRYIPRSTPGVRLPHTWVSYAGEKISVLDLIDGRSFILLVPQDFDHEPLQTIDFNGSSVPVRTLRVDDDLHVLDESWLEVVGLSQKNVGLLVRPDQHVLRAFGSMQDVRRLLEASLQP